MTVSVGLSPQSLLCCRESSSVRLVGEGPWALSVSTGAKPVANGSVQAGAMAWHSKGCCGKGCAAPRLGNVSVPELDDGSGAGCKARCSFTQPGDWTQSRASLLPGQAPAR